jgi:hypothetical protein
MSARLILHIGSPKTGSTALQKALYLNRDALKSQGVSYAEVNLRGYGHHDLAYLLGGGYPDFATPQPRPLAELLLELDQALAEPVETVVISSENFYLYPNPGPLKEAIAKSPVSRQVAVVVYVRRQDELAVSWYNQAVKAQGYTGDFQKHLKEMLKLWDLEQALKPWVAAFGQESICLRVYEQLDILADFSMLTGIQFEQLPVEPTNTRLVRDLLELQRITNRLPLSIQEKRRYHHELMALSRSPDVLELLNDTPLLSPEEARAILAHFEASNQRTARKFLKRDQLFLAPLFDGPTPPPYPGLKVETLALVSSWLLAKR